MCMVLQLMTADQGEAHCMQGASMIKLYTQIGAVVYAVILGAKRAIELRGFAAHQAGFVTSTMLQLVAGASLLRFAMDQNEAQGLGDGVSLLIGAGIGASKFLCSAWPCRNPA